MSDQKKAVFVVGISAGDQLKLEAVLMDADSEAALEFLRKVIWRPLQQSEARGMRTQLLP